MGGLLDAMSFLGGVGDRAREYDVEENKRTQKIAELKAKRTDELLKTKWTSAKKKRDEHEKINNEVESGSGVDSLSGQMLLKGITTVDEYWKRRNSEGDSWKHSTLFELGETPTITYADEDAIYKKTLKNQGTTAGRIFESLGGPKRDEVTSVPTDIESGSAPTYRRGKEVPLTEQQTTKMNEWKSSEDDNRLEVEKQAAYHFEQYSNPNIFPEYANATIPALKRLAFDVANGTVKVTPDGIPWNVREENEAFYTNDLFEDKVETVSTDPVIKTLAAKKAEKKAKDTAKKNAEDLKKKIAAEKRSREKTQPSKVTQNDMTNAQDYMKTATFTTPGNKQISFSDELSEEHRNTMSLYIAGDVNLIINQARISPTAATKLALKIAKTGLVYDKRHPIADVFTDDFTFRNPTVTWKNVFDTYNEYKITRPNTTYDEVLDKIIEQQSK